MIWGCEWMATIVTHNGSKVALGHNRREEKIVSKEEHIDLQGKHENWVDCGSVEMAYQFVFGQAIEEYNQKQIKNRHYDKQTSVSEFLKEIQQHEYKKPMYEMVVGVYGDDVSEREKKEILRDFARGWKERNPNLVMVGCYYHNDEEGGQHIHIDYIPIYHAKQRGIGLKQGLTKALEEMGIEEPGESLGRFDKHHTRQIEWEKRENQVLEELCQARGIEVQHSGITRPHLEPEEYKAMRIRQENRELKEENARQQEINAKNQKALQKQVAQYNKQKEEMEYMQKQLAYAQAKLDKIKNDYVDESFGNMKQFATKEAINEKKKELDL